MAFRNNPMKRRHDMPFGGQLQSDGKVRFRLWAPKARRVELCLAGGDSSSHLPLESVGDGWHELITSEAKAGDSYLFRIDGDKRVPDPASRFQPFDVHGPSEVVNPNAFDWQDGAWRGRPWKEAVIYELHVGTFTAAGTFSGAKERLAYLAEVGITALELMPVADFPGGRNWGYDGVFPFAPDSVYGRPEDLKDLIQSAHSHGLMVFLDVVYNHFGPEGNYLGSYAPQFFTERYRSPWGDGINFDGADSRPVRDFFIQNALYWLAEYNLDGLRLDAVHAIVDDSKPDILNALVEAVRNTVAPGRHVHLVLENDRNQASYLQRTRECRPRSFTAQWNDDFHHALQVLITGERDGYYVDYAENPIDHLGRCLTAGFAYQGEKSLFRDGELRGESTTGVPLTAFVTFLQNHDQIGNRAFGERLTTLVDSRVLHVAEAILLLAPSPPLIFMGEEFGAESPFLFFCDFEKNLAAAVTAGRRNEFARFTAFRSPTERERIPDPSAPRTFELSKLDWSELQQSRHQDWLGFYRELLRLRREYILPRLSDPCSLRAEYATYGDHGLSVHWKFTLQSELILFANLGSAPLSVEPPSISQVIYASDGKDESSKSGVLAPWSMALCLP
jgi:malto-oligosyltrehalose trehalohydrolase